MPQNMMDAERDPTSGLLSKKQTARYQPHQYWTESMMKPRSAGLWVFAIVCLIALSAWVRPWSSSIDTIAKASSDSHIFNSTLGFEKLLVITLPERSDNRDVLALQGSLTDLQFEFVDGVHGDDVPERALPPGGGQRLGTASKGSWRGHINALRQVVEQGLGSAIIFEDDVDWDVRIKDQLHDFATASIALIDDLDPTSRANPGHEGSIDFTNIPRSRTPHSSPYGDDWDVLWVGHCGIRRVQDDMATPFAAALVQDIPKAHVVYEHDETVPEKEYIGVFDNPGHPDFRKDFDDHTRVYHHALDGICSLAYAVSQAGARKLLYEVGIKQYNDAFDIMLRQFCDGTTGHKKHLCLTVQPALFDHHRPVGQIQHNGEARETAVTFNIRQSARLNIPKLLKGDVDYDDQYPDTRPT